tara:strand:- start:41 stop:307 length:267 start_codon:yes stop_codon:yes gene_type:complete
VPDFIEKFVVGLKVFEALAIGFANGGNTESADLPILIEAVALKIALEGFRSLSDRKRVAFLGVMIHADVVVIGFLKCLIDCVSIPIFS